jgi:hypothetical protein
VGCPNETYVHNLPPKAWQSEVGSNSQFHFVNTQTGKRLAWRDRFGISLAKAVTHASDLTWRSWKICHVTLSGNRDSNYANDREPLSGLVERVTFHNPDSGFCVLRVKVSGHHELVTLLGSAPSVAAGEYIQASGNWETHRDHGRQFRATLLRVTPPTSAEGMEKYLGSGLIKGIGPVFAQRLVSAFNEAVFEVIEREPHRLFEVEGIGRKRAAPDAADTERTYSLFRVHHR